MGNKCHKEVVHMINIIFAKTNRQMAVDQLANIQGPIKMAIAFKI